MNEIIVQDNIKIEDLIYEVRGKQVMLAHDLATLYGVTSEKNLIHNLLFPQLE